MQSQQEPLKTLRCSGPIETATIALSTPYRQASLLQIIQCIALAGDHEALNELLKNRPLFFFSNKRRLRLSEYIYELWRSYAMAIHGGATLIWDKTRDLTLDKFITIPMDCKSKQDAPQQINGSIPKCKVDCRNYYRALLTVIKRHPAMQQVQTPWQQEEVISRLFQRFIKRHFLLSYREAWRNVNPFVSRYTWQCNGKGTLTLWMPKYLKGRQRRTWLETHIPDVNPQSPGERERVQAIIQEKLVIPTYIPLDTEWMIEPGKDVIHHTTASQDKKPSFIGFLAREKSLSAEMQRPRIRMLGPKRIERLVMSVLHNLITPERTDEDIAREFGLATATYSRFCGSEWQKSVGTKEQDIPDLWRNVAVLLSQVEAFRELAMESGVLNTIRTIENDGKAPRLLRSKGHE